MISVHWAVLGRCDNDTALQVYEIRESAHVYSRRAGYRSTRYPFIFIRDHSDPNGGCTSSVPLSSAARRGAEDA